MAVLREHFIPLFSKQNIHSGHNDDNMYFDHKDVDGIIRLGEMRLAMLPTAKLIDAQVSFLIGTLGLASRLGKAKPLRYSADGLLYMRQRA